MHVLRCYGRLGKSFSLSKPTYVDPSQNAELGGLIAPASVANGSQ